MDGKATHKCEVCGKTGNTCTFQNGCSCWYGIPCKPKKQCNTGGKV